MNAYAFATCNFIIKIREVTEAEKHVNFDRNCLNKNHIFHFQSLKETLLYLRQFWHILNLLLLH